jgi:adenine-specific DNA-methyltransferase
MEKWDKEDKLWFPEDKLQNINRKIYLDEYKGQPVSSLWTDISVINPMSKERGEFESGQKPEALIHRILQMTTIEGDLVLDSFVGSGTLCSVAHKTKRQFIGIEQLDYVNAIPVSRMRNVLKGDDVGISKSVNWQGGGDFIYCELKRYNEVFMDKMQTAKTTEELVEIWKDIAENSFLNWYVNPEIPEETVNDFMEIGKEENGLDKQKKLLTELLNKNQLYVNLSEIDDEDFQISEEDKKLNQSFYGEAYNG